MLLLGGLGAWMVKRKDNWLIVRRLQEEVHGRGDQVDDAHVFLVCQLSAAVNNSRARKAGEGPNVLSSSCMVVVPPSQSLNFQ